jgi:hypothetical protein
MSFQSSWFTFKSSADNDDINAALEELQKKGAKIRDVEVSVGGSFWNRSVAIFLIVYDAEAPIAEDA